jgi:hypothetical protein
MTVHPDIPPLIEVMPGLSADAVLEAGRSLIAMRCPVMPDSNNNAATVAEENYLSFRCGGQ